jgi:hypothetical protein
VNITTKKKKKQEFYIITHSHTAQYAITASGKLLPTMFISLQQRSGAFCPPISEEVNTLSRKFGNIFVTVTKSRKPQKETCKQFLDNVIRPYVKNNKFMLYLIPEEDKLTHHFMMRNLMMVMISPRVQ